MSLTDLLNYLTQAVFIAITGLTLFAWLRRRTQEQFDIALVFVLLTTAILGQYLQALFPSLAVLFAIVLFYALLAQPHALLRVTRHFRPIPKAIRRISFWGLIAVMATVLIASMFPIPATIYILVYFSFVNVYATVQLIKEAKAVAGITRKRLAIAATAAGLFTFVFSLAFVIALLAALKIQVPAFLQLSGIPTQIIGLVSALSFYFGFAPPRWLRRAWQRRELYLFLRSSPQSNGMQAISDRLETFARRAAGGKSSFTRVRPDDPVLAGVWDSRKPLIIRRTVKKKSRKADWETALDATNAKTLFAVPIVSSEKCWALLTLALPYSPLFAEDDVELLSMFADQSAVIFEHEDFVEKLEESNHILERRVQERTDELSRANWALRASMERLEASNRELQDFANVATHDLQEPLRKIQTFSDRLKRSLTTEPDGQTLDYAERMIRAAARMQALIDDLLSFSRVTTQAKPFANVDLNKTIANVLDDLEILISETKGSVEVEQLPELKADPTQMRQMMQNLVTNALRFHKPGRKPLVRISAELESGACRLIVSDDGIGFDEKYLSKIFKPFQRLSGEGQGTGIGLAIVRKIVERHKGLVTASSSPDRGATFVVTLPLNHEESPNVEPA